MESLRLLYLGSNRLRGEIPAELGKLENLTALSLYGNRLSRQIAATVAGQSGQSNVAEPGPDRT